MAKQLTSLTVFVSGPSEAEAEKAALRTVLADLGEVLEKTHKVTLRLIGWPGSVRPGVGPDPQSVINRQVSDEYDIYVGVLGSRFGQPTPRAASGTEEEFRRALERFRRDTTSVRLLFYFKRAPQDPFSLDLVQLQNVHTFRDELGTCGVLYQDFTDTAEFTDLVRKHVHHLIVDEWKEGRWGPVDVGATAVAAETVEVSESGHDAKASGAEPGPEQRTDVDEGDDDELGLLELFEEFERSTQAATAILGRISEHTTTLGQQFEQRTAEVNKLMEKQRQVEQVGGSRTKQEYFAQAKDIVNHSATDLEQYAADMGTDLQRFKVENRSMFETLRRGIAVQQEFDASAARLGEDQKGLEGLVHALTSNRDTVTSLQASVARMPALTGRLRKARKRVSSTLGELIAEVQFSIEEANRILTSFPYQRR